MPLFSLLFVAFHSPFKTIEKNILSANPSEIEIIIVDNSENNEYFSNLRSWVTTLPESIQNNIIIYQAKINGGYTRGNNLAAKFATGDYLLIINPDMALGPDFFHYAKNIIKQKGWKIISPKIYFDLNSKLLQSTFMKFEKHMPGSTFVPVGLNTIDNGDYNAYYETFFATGGCLLIERELFNQLHGFDESYFMYAERNRFMLPSSDIKYQGSILPSISCSAS